MKKLITTLTVLAVSGSFAVAGGGKAPVIEDKIPLGCACFDPGFEFSGFAAGILPEEWGDDELGGGVSLAYFLSENIGVELSYSVLATDSEEHVVTGNIVYRFPIKDICVAPYVLVGGGLVTNSDTHGLFDVGGGIDVRFDSWGCIGIFADATYNWVEDDGQDFTLIRAGFRVPF
ncbi:MAG: outer membrane beta-barrel protein [Verrucomicrobiales bacterium]|nr:outer membrane beta-barrel protein [Verrucomicrobiales bacterium]